MVLNHSEVSTGKPGVRLSLSQPSGQVEDIGGRLEQKVKQLEEERKNMRKETQSHHQHIDKGINTLQERIADLEQSKEGHGVNSIAGHVPHFLVIVLY